MSCIYSNAKHIYYADAMPPFFYVHLHFLGDFILVYLGRILTGSYDMYVTVDIINQPSVMEETCWDTM